MPAPPIGARLTREFCLDAAAIRTTALQVGDLNPLHHSEAFAAASRFGELIASGAYTSGLLAGTLSEGFGDEPANAPRPDPGPDPDPGHVGVDYKVRFKGPVRVDRLMRLDWVVVAHEPRRSGTLARLQGSITDTTDGTIAVSAEMTVLYFGPMASSAPGSSARE